MSPSPQTDFASKAIALGHATLATDARTGIFQIYSGHLLLARQALASSDAKCYEMLRHAADIVRTGFSEYNVVPSPERQNDCIIFAAVGGDLTCAIELAAIEPDYSTSHGFDVALSRTLRSLLSSTDLPSTTYHPTSAETGLFEALSSVRTNTFSTAGTERYWRATRRKRYKNTIHEQRDFFPKYSKSSTKSPNQALQRTASPSGSGVLGNPTAAGAAPVTPPATTCAPAGAAPRTPPARSVSVSARANPRRRSLSFSSLGDSTRTL